MLPTLATSAPETLKDQSEDDETLKDQSEDDVMNFDGTLKLPHSETSDQLFADSGLGDDSPVRPAELSPYSANIKSDWPKHDIKESIIEFTMDDVRTAMDTSQITYPHWRLCNLQNHLPTTLVRMQSQQDTHQVALGSNAKGTRATPMHL